MEILLEGKKIDSEYQKDWSEIEREVFDQIISLDPNTNIDNDRIGPSAKQLLLPSYINGETDFLDNADEVKKCLDTYTKNRGQYPQSLRNISSFPSVKDFVDYITNGDESEFAKRFDFNADKKEEPKEDKLTSIYNKYYKEKIDRETFDKIIAFDPQTTATSIGTIAKNLLLPRFIAGEDFLNDGLRLEQAINSFYADKDTYPADKRDIGKYPTVKDFIEYVLAGPDSDFVKYLKSVLRDDQIKFLGSTKTYDIIQPLCYEAAWRIVGKKSQRDSHYDLSWCTGYMNDDNYWRTYSRNGPIVCFIWKQDRTDRKKCFQLNINNNGTVYEFLDGNDSNPGNKGKEGNFETFLWGNIDVFLAIKNLDIFKNNPSVIKCSNKLNALNKPVDIKSLEDITKLETDDIKSIVPEVTIYLETVPTAAFADCGALKKVTFVEGVKKIGVQAFLNCRTLKEISLPNSLEEISAEAFAGCVSLGRTIRVPDNLIKIGREAFRDTSVTLSVNKNRQKPLHLNPADKDWYASHMKGITVQEGLEEDMELKESHKYTPEEFRLALQNGESIEIGYNYDDVDYAHEFEDEEPYGSTLYRVEEEDGIYFLIKVYVSEWGSENEGEIKEFNTFNDLMHAINSIRLYDCSIIKEELDEDIIDENIPRDLARAYQNSQSAVNGIQSHPESEHSNIGNKANRRTVKYDYFNSNYEEISKQEAINYLGLHVDIKDERDEDGKIVAKVRTTDREAFNERISTLRFIIDNKVIEYEVRTGNTLYLAYWMEIPSRYFGEYPYFKGKGSDTTDVRFANKYSDIYTVIMISDKIYKTDEYEHKITDTTPTGKKVKVLRRDASGNPVKDKDGNLVYDVIDDTIQKRRERNKQGKKIHTEIPVGDPSHADHASGRNFGGSPNSYSETPYTKFSLDNPDTGAHDKENIYKDVQRLKSNSYGTRYTEYNKYVTALKAKDEAFKKYDYIRQALKKLESEQEMYEPDEYEELHAKLLEKKTARYAEYQEAALEVRKAKDKLLLVVDEITYEINKRVKKILTDIEELKNKEFKLYQKTIELRNKNIYSSSSRLKTLQNRLQELQNEITQYEKKKQELKDQIAELNRKLEANDISITTAIEKITQAKSQVEELADEEIQAKFKELDDIEREMAELQGQIDTLSPAQAELKAQKAAKNKKKELDPSLNNILVFDNEETSSDQVNA